VTEWLRVKNWDRFQHYKDRSPPWIKLHYTTLDDYAWSHLPDTAKAHLMGIWLLASRQDGRIPNDAAWLGTRIGARSKVDLGVLIRAGFLEKDASTSLASSDSTALDLEEKSREEAEKRRDREEAERELGAFSAAWKDYPRRPNDSKANALRAWMARRGEGVTSEQLHEGVRRYAAYVKRERTEGKYIKQGATFFGPGQHWQSDYSSTAPAPRPTAPAVTYPKYQAPEIPASERVSPERMKEIIGSIGRTMPKGAA
jgi:hypothetical protein